MGWGGQCYNGGEVGNVTQRVGWAMLHIVGWGNVTQGVGWGRSSVIQSRVGWGSITQSRVGWGQDSVTQGGVGVTIIIAFFV